MSRHKKKQLDRLQAILSANSPDHTMSEQDDLNVLTELKEEVSPDILKSYLEEQREKYRQMQNRSEEKKISRPFAGVSTDRIRELITHPHIDVALGTKLELARRDFFYFCHLRKPGFYRSDRPYIVRLCRELQAFYESDELVMIVSLPPRHGKSFTAGLFEQWVFGKNATLKVMTGSYNKELSTSFSKTVRDGIDEEKVDPGVIVYHDIFPDVRIQQGEAAMNKWALEGQYASYLATSPDGSATGFGASLLVIDDLVKKALEAFHEELLNSHWKWFTDTMLSRLESGGKILIIMTRWARGDLAGRAEEYFKKEGYPCRVLSMKALQNEKTGEMLCPDILSYKDYLMKTGAMSPEIASANYQQIPVDMKGRLYQRFQTYQYLPVNEHGTSLFTAVRAYCDTADEGSDYLCCIIYGVYLERAYVLDVYYTRDPMEVTEPETARRLFAYGVREGRIESNNGGKGFARNVQRILRDVHHCVRCVIQWFHQSENKRARILTNATLVQNAILYPVDWKTRWPEYHEAMFKYQKEGKNKHDDAPDATTGVAENLVGGGVILRMLGEETQPDLSADAVPTEGQTSIAGQLKRVFGYLTNSQHDRWF